MHRESDKHGPLHDDELKHELEGTLRGNRSSRAEEWRDPEPPADDDEVPPPRQERNPTMAQLVRDVMTPDPVAMPADTPVRQAALAMRDQDIGNVLVLDGELLRGIVTDRDLVVRGLAERDDLSGLSLREVCSDRLITAGPDEEADAAIARMRDNAVRRIPVVDNGRPVGVLSIGDAAVIRDRRSALADISAAPGNT